ncbi:hypothetical protein MKW98_015583, partial [Papaver atlanticum]
GDARVTLRHNRETLLSYLNGCLGAQVLHDLYNSLIGNSTVSSDHGTQRGIRKYFATRLLLAAQVQRFCLISAIISLRRVI